MHLRPANNDDSALRPQPVAYTSMLAKVELANLVEREMLNRAADQPWRSVSFNQNNLDEFQTAATDHQSLLRRLSSVDINIRGDVGGRAVNSGASRLIDTRSSSVAVIKSSSKRFGYYRYCEGNIQPAVRCAFIEDIMS